MKLKHGLTIPPINAPVLPVGYFYKIKIQHGRYNDHPNWYVRVMKRHRFWNEMISRGWSDSRLVPTEELLTIACDNASEAMICKIGFRFLEDQYTGNWSGQ